VCRASNVDGIVGRAVSVGPGHVDDPAVPGVDGEGEAGTDALVTEQRAERRDGHTCDDANAGQRIAGIEQVLEAAGTGSPIVVACHHHIGSYSPDAEASPAEISGIDGATVMDGRSNGGAVLA